MSPEVKTKSILTCPVCNFEKEEEMPSNACMISYDCECCHTEMRPKPGDCCVFCSYGTIKCPPVQMEMNCCS